MFYMADVSPTLPLQISLLMKATLCQSSWPHHCDLGHEVLLMYCYFKAWSCLLPTMFTRLSLLVGESCVSSFLELAALIFLFLTYNSEVLTRDHFPTFLMGSVAVWNCLQLVSCEGNQDETEQEPNLGKHWWGSCLGFTTLTFLVIYAYSI